MEKIRFIDFELAYVQRGTGTPLVLIHGFPLDGRLWDPLAPLLESQFELLIPDLRGFGQSTPGMEPPSMATYAHDIANLLDYFGYQKALIAGHSMGGYLALAFAHLYPERVSGLGLIATQALPDTPERRQGRYDTAAQVGIHGVNVVAEAMTAKFSPREDVQALAREMIMRQHPQGVMDALKAIADRNDSSSGLAGFQFPVAIVHGDADALIPIERAREMKAAIPHAQLIELSGAGHLPMLEDPQQTADALRRLG